MRRLLFLIALLVLSFLAVARTVPVSGNPHFAEIRACRAHPDARCLLDLAVSLRLSGEPSKDDDTIVTQLLFAGRLKDAEVVVSSRKSATSEDERYTTRSIEECLARYRFVTALRNGARLDEALRQAPDLSPGGFYLAALTLLGTQVSGWLEPLPPPPGPRERTLAGEIAQRLEAHAGEGPEWMWNLSLEDAAKIYARLGDGQAARRSMGALVPRENGTTVFPETVFREVGVEATLATLQRLKRITPYAYMRAASAAGTPEQSRALIEKAFELASAPNPLWPDFSKMKKVVRTAVDVGHADQARELAYRMERLAETTHSPLQVFGHLDAAAALLISGAPRGDILATLDRAEKLFPANPSSIVAFGLVGGAYQWKQSGLEDEARLSIASISLDLRDLPRAERMVARMNNPSNWVNLDLLGYPPGVSDTLFRMARQKLSPHDYTYFACQTARRASRPGKSADQRNRALHLARREFASGEIDGPNAEAILTAIAIVASRGSDQALKSRALNRLAQWALTRPVPAKVIAAASLIRALE